MTHYTQRWTCLLCGERQDTVGWPKVDVCHVCIERNRGVREARAESRRAQERLDAAIAAVLALAQRQDDVLVSSPHAANTDTT